jgi:hypothetical protein
MNAVPDPQGPDEIVGYHGAVSDFKRRLIEATLHQARGNRTHAARTLGLQRTYLLRLMRELRVAAPPPPSRAARASAADGAVGTNGALARNGASVRHAAATNTPLDTGVGRALTSPPARPADAQRTPTPPPSAPALVPPGRPPARAASRRLSR